MSETFDAVFIGAGHTPLACALHLAVRGWRVGLFEQAGVAGGAVKTGDYTLPGFRHDWAAMNLSLFAGSAFFKAHAAELVKHGADFVPVSHPFASAFPDGTWCGVSTDMAATTARIAGNSTQDAATWQTLVAGFGAEAPHLFGLLGSPMKMRALAYFGFKTLRAKGFGGTADMGRFLLQSPRDWLGQTFQSPKVQAMPAQAFGMALGKGGADTIIRAMVAAIEARGGRVETGATVSRILHTNGKATGIELADGRKIMAEKAVIAGVAPRALPRLTGTASDYDQKLTDFTHAPGTMMIHLALDALPDWAAGPDLHRFAYIHLAPSLDQMARTYQQAQAGLLPDEPILVVSQPTTQDPSRAPDGKHVLWVQVRMAPGTIRGDAAGQITATDWSTAADPFATRALDILERYA